MGTSPTDGEIRMPPVNCTPTILINGDGEFNESALDFTQGGGASIAVVAIMGPQSSGKSTLLNHLFGTNFEVMNAHIARRKTTKGIWIAKAPHMEPVTLVLDLEGTDGKERGEDDRTFEKQSALFALAVADTVLINMWGKDIGLEHAANRPLLRTIFEVILSFSSQKTSLIFVVRDKPAETPLEVFVHHLEDDLNKIWEAVRKPKGHERTAFGTKFSMVVFVLPSYEYMRAEFDQEVDQLKLRIVSSHQKGDNNYLPTLRIFMTSAKKTWDMIKENKDLQVPPFKVMVATMRCEEIVFRELGLLKSNQAWLELQQNAKNYLVKDFGKRTSLILDASLSKYDEESMNLEENVTKDKRHFLMSEALKVVHPAYMHTLGHIRSEALQSFKTQLEKSGINFSESAVRRGHDSCLLQFTQQCSDYAAIKQANWKDDVSTVRQELLRAIKEHALYQLREQLSMSLTTEMEISKVMEHPNDVWGRIRSVIKRESERAESAIVDILGVEKEEVGRIIADLKQHAANRVETFFKDESRYVATLMKKRFVFVLSTSKSPTVKEKAYSQCLDILSTMAVIRLDNNHDSVRRLLYSGLMDAHKISPDPLSSITWEKVPSQKTLITPIKCRDIWNKFKLDIELCLANDRLYQQKQREKKDEGWSLPTWAIVGLLSLGSAALIGLAICYPVAAAPLITYAITLATTAGTIVFKQGICRCSDTNEIIEKGEVLKYPKTKAALQKNLDEVCASLISG